MKNFILFILTFASQFYFYAQKFPVSFEIRRSYQECSQCQVETRSNWSLVNPNSYSDKIRDAIENKIFVEKSYAETLGYYLDVNEKDYDKECEVSRSGKHVWKDKVSSLKDNMSKDYFTEYHKNEAVRKDKLSKEEIKEEETKKQINNRNAVIAQMEKQIIELRNQSNDLKVKNDYNGSLDKQSKILIIWNAIDSLYDLNYGNKNLYFYPMKIDEYRNDVYKYTFDLILQGQSNKAYNITEEYLREGSSSWRNINWNDRSEIWYDFKVKVNYFHSFLFSENYKTKKGDFYLKLRRDDTDKDVYGKNPLYKQLLIDYEQFKKCGLTIPDEQYLKLLLHCRLKDVKFILSQYAPKSMNDWFSKRETLPKNFSESFDYQYYDGCGWSFGECRNGDGNVIKKIEDNLFSLDDKAYSFKIFFYIDNQSNIHFINKCKLDLSEKALAKIIAKSKEIRDIDLGIISPK